MLVRVYIPADRAYSESAATLEAESGYEMETPPVARFRQHVLEGEWNKAEAALKGLGVSEEEGLLVRRSIRPFRPHG